MNNEILEVINKNLPEATSGALKEYLDKAEKTAFNLQETKAELKRVLDERGVIQDKHDKLHAMYLNQYALDKREQELTKRENDLKVTLAEAATKAAERRADDVFKLAETVFKNPRLTYNDVGSTNHNSSQGYHSTSTSRVITAEEVK
jgi:hypothetical protein